MKDPVDIIQLAQTTQDNEFIADLALGLRKVAKEEQATCTLCGFVVHGESMGEILEQLGKHGEEVHGL